MIFFCFSVRIKNNLKTGIKVHTHMHAHTLILHTQIPSPLQQSGKRNIRTGFSATKKLICTVSVLVSWCVRSCWRTSDAQRTGRPGECVAVSGIPKKALRRPEEGLTVYVFFSKEFTRKIGETPHLRSTPFIQSQESTLPAT